MADVGGVLDRIRRRFQLCFQRPYGIALVGIWLAILVGVAAHAVTISVSEFALTGSPSAMIHDEFTILNEEQREIAVALVPVDWYTDAEGVTRFQEPGAQTRSCAGWIQVGPVEGRLSPGAEMDVAFDLQVPDEAFGTYWAGFLIDAASVPDDGLDAGIHLQRQFLVRVFVTIPPIHPEGRVSVVRAEGLSPLGIQVGFDNTGDTLLKKVSGLVVVESATGATVLELPVVPFDALPGETVMQDIHSSWALQEEGVYLIRAVLDFGGEYLVAGQTFLRLASLVLTPVGTSRQIPSDLNGDGLYEDVNGDGVLTPIDVDVFVQFVDTQPIQRNIRAFDFNNDGSATLSDAEILRTAVLRGLD